MSYWSCQLWNDPYKANSFRINARFARWSVHFLHLWTCNDASAGLAALWRGSYRAASTKLLRYYPETRFYHDKMVENGFISIDKRCMNGLLMNKVANNAATTISLQHTSLDLSLIPLASDTSLLASLDIWGNADERNWSGGCGSFYTFEWKVFNQSDPLEFDWPKKFLCAL